ncbi:hypothetical protein BDQ12DRAFT_386204 [Crucibulum laeve]|uniref:Uncharacterized protein n=1 Tax=Crucibulum laeve TaxID=68775 RepID=A0A5C3M9X0_9AGAR|nr:hypothetical protein BDQ12DRAFT_386204 [Crucibulum laeve]
MRETAFSIGPDVFVNYRDASEVFLVDDGAGEGGGCVLVRIWAIGDSPTAITSLRARCEDEDGRRESKRRDASNSSQHGALARCLHDAWLGVVINEGEGACVGLRSIVNYGDAFESF